RWSSTPPARSPSTSARCWPSGSAAASSRRRAPASTRPPSRRTATAPAPPEDRRPRSPVAQRRPPAPGLQIIRVGWPPGFHGAPARGGVMRKVVFFMMTTLNGLYERGRWDVDPNGIDWHQTDEEFEAFAAAQLGDADTILFGRVTYEGMATYWPTDEAIASDPEVAEKMNALPKVVFSRTLASVDWENSR